MSKRKRDDPLGKEEDPDRKKARKLVEQEAKKGGTERVTPAEEVAAVLGHEILRADTELDVYPIDKFTPQARLIIVLGK